MSSQAWFAKYKSPQWQRKRLEVLNAADFKCEMCAKSDTTLNVHHPFYNKGADPWEYYTEDLFCLCEGCHLEFERTVRKNALYVACLLPIEKTRKVLAFIHRSIYDKSWDGEITSLFSLCKKHSKKFDLKKKKENSK